MQSEFWMEITIDQENTMSILKTIRETAKKNGKIPEIIGSHSVSCEQNLFIMYLDKCKTFLWKFNIKANSSKYINISRIYLLDDHLPEYSLDYVSINNLSSRLDNSCQLWENNFQSNIYNLQIVIQFYSENYGNFEQHLVCEFENGDKVVKHIGVQVSLESKLMSALYFTPVRDAENELVWIEKHKIIPYDGEPDISLETVKYPLPPNIEDLVRYGAFDNLGSKLTKENYKERLHLLLHIEEYHRRSEIHKLSLEIDSIRKYIREPVPGIHHHPILKLPADEFQTEQACQLIGKSGKALMKLTNMRTQEQKVFELLLEKILSNEYVLELSSKLVEYIGECKAPLQASICFRFVDVFQYMHCAIDNIYLPDVFPKHPQLRSSIWTSFQHLDLSKEQSVALKKMIEPKPGPPVLVLGPFGSGKTRTMATGILELLKEVEFGKANHRILICTHSNSAADHYIEDFIDPYLNAAAFKNNILIRVNWELRYTASVSRTVLNYCEVRDGKFVQPTKEEIEKYNVVVCTLVTADILLQAKISRGHFSHIFIDEAAQAMEVEAIIPLTLKGERTKVILAGDHLQLGPYLSSPTAKQLGLGISLLERLFQEYPETSIYKLKLLENYRSFKDIVEISSALFYEGALLSNIERPAGIGYPLKFYGIHGKEVLSMYHPSYYNLAEAHEVLCRIEDLMRDWPKQLGKLDVTKICVLSCFAAQIQEIRLVLRRNGLSGVRVENVNNVQGLEFDVVILSTVRSYTTLSLQKNLQQTDIGFLSNPKLLNTAITRAKYLCIFVGEPVALCSFGACKACWKTVLASCRNHGEFHYRLSFESVMEISYKLGQTVRPDDDERERTESLRAVFEEEQSIGASSFSSESLQSSPQGSERSFGTYKSSESVPYGLKSHEPSKSVLHGISYASSDLPKRSVKHRDYVSMHKGLQSSPHDSERSVGSNTSTENTPYGLKYPDETLAAPNVKQEVDWSSKGLQASPPDSERTVNAHKLTEIIQYGVTYTVKPSVTPIDKQRDLASLKGFQASPHGSEKSVGPNRSSESDPFGLAFTDNTSAMSVPKKEESTTFNAQESVLPNNPSVTKAGSDSVVMSSTSNQTNVSKTLPGCPIAVVMPVAAAPAYGTPTTGIRASVSPNQRLQAPVFPQLQPIGFQPFQQISLSPIQPMPASPYLVQGNNWPRAANVGLNTMQYMTAPTPHLGQSAQSMLNTAIVECETSKFYTWKFIDYLCTKLSLNNFELQKHRLSLEQIYADSNNFLIGMPRYDATFATQRLLGYKQQYIDVLRNFESALLKLLPKPTQDAVLAGKLHCEGAFVELLRLKSSLELQCQQKKEIIATRQNVAKINQIAMLIEKLYSLVLFLQFQVVYVIRPHVQNADLEVADSNARDVLLCCIKIKFISHVIDSIKTEANELDNLIKEAKFEQFESFSSTSSNVSSIDQELINQFLASSDSELSSALDVAASSPGRSSLDHSKIDEKSRNDASLTTIENTGLGNEVAGMPVNQKPSYSAVVVSQTATVANAQQLSNNIASKEPEQVSTNNDDNNAIEDTISNLLSMTDEENTGKLDREVDDITGLIQSLRSSDSDVDEWFIDRRSDPFVKEYIASFERHLAARLPSPEVSSESNPQIESWVVKYKMTPRYKPYADTGLSGTASLEGTISFEINSSHDKPVGVILHGNLHIYFIGLDAINRALTGDKVQFEVTGWFSYRSHHQGRVVRVVERGKWSVLCKGSLTDHNLMIPADERGPPIIVANVPEEDSNRHVVRSTVRKFIVKILGWPLDIKYPVGIIEESVQNV